MRTTRVQVGDSLDQVLAQLGEALGLPGHYGANLDALADCLTELEQPITLVLDGWQRLAWADPRGWARLREVLDARSRGVEGRSGVLPLSDFRVQAGSDS